ncbi:MFS transporter [Bacillus taeanensis]|nr:MFS transporter [Bacillus taeanensis]
MKHYFLYLVSALFVLIPISAVRPMTSLFAESLGASVMEVGILTACYSLIPLFLAVSTGRFIDRIGEKIPILIGSSGMALAFTIPFLFPNLIALYFSQLLLGGSHFLTFVAVQKGVTQSVPYNNRDSAIATFSLFVSSGMMVGPLIGGYSSEHIGFQDSYLLYTVITMCLLVIGLLNKGKGQDQNASSQERNVKEVFMIPGIKSAFFISMLNLGALDIFYVYFPLYANSIGLSPSQIGWILTIQSLASVITRVFIPKLVHRYEKFRVLSVFMFIGAIAYGSLSFMNGFVSMLIAATIFGVGLGIVQPLTIMVTVSLAPEERTGEVLSLRIAGNRLSQIVMPLLIAGVTTVTGVSFIFAFNAIFLTLGSMMSSRIDDRSSVKSVIKS